MRVNKAVRCISAVAAVMMIMGRNLRAVCETPEDTRVYVFVPYATDHSSLMTNELKDQGYTYDPLIHKYRDPDPGDNDPGVCTPANFRTLLGQGVNLWIVCHSGVAWGVSVSSYLDSAVRNQEYDRIVPSIFSPDELATGQTTDNFYCIRVTPAAIAAWSTAKKQILFLSGCDTSALFGQFQGGLELGYEWDHYWDESATNAPLLFQNMSGRLNSGTKRRSVSALAVAGYTANFRYSGSLSAGLGAVLAPTVVDYWPKINACQECPGWVEFDCKMDTAAPDYVLTSTGCGVVTGESWNGTNYKLSFGFTSLDTGSSMTVIVNKNYAKSGNNGVKLDHDKVAPNDTAHFQWTLSCTQSACDPGFVQPDSRMVYGLEKLRGAAQ